MIKKILVTAAVAASMSPFANADDSAGKQLYLGLNLGFGSAEETADFEDEETDFDADISSTRFAAGYILDDRIRLEASYGGYDLEYDDGSDDGEVTTFEVDGYLLFPQQNVSPYVIAGLGLATFEDTAQFFEDDEDLTGIAVQFGGGLIFALHESIELDASYRFKTITWLPLEVSGTDSELEISHTIGLFNFGARVLF